MGTITRAGVTVICLALAPAIAVADANNRWYATANIGFGTLADSTLNYSDGTEAGTAEAAFDPSFAGGGTIGYQFANGWSLEGEIMYRRNDLEALDIPGLGDFTEGDFASLALGVNALYRFNFGDSGKWSGYIGPGIVYLQEIDIDFDTAGQQETSFETDDTALQLKLGARYDFSDRWFAEASATWMTASGVTMELPEDSVQTIESDYDHLTISAGIGFRF